MALRNQPYLPLYVQDYLTDEKLNECTASAQGIYIKIMCLMHKSKEYGKILLKQKDRQTSKPVQNFAYKLTKHLPFTAAEIESALNELISEDVLQLDKDGLILSQKRMIKDNDISMKRSVAGKKGYFAKANATATSSANSEDEDEADIDINVLDINVLKDSENLNKLFIARWSRNCKNNSELQGAENLLKEFGYEKLSEAFRIAGERGNDNVAYVRGILNSNGKKPKRTGDFKTISEQIKGEE